MALVATVQVRKLTLKLEKSPFNSRLLTAIRDISKFDLDQQLLRFQRQMANSKPLNIDELKFVPLSTTRAEIPFDPISKRPERNSKLIAENFSFLNGWKDLA